MSYGFIVLVPSATHVGAVVVIVGMSGIALTVSVPVAVSSGVHPTVVTVYVNGDPTAVVGVPLMVRTPAKYVPVTPVGKPVTVAPVASPPTVYTMSAMAVFSQTV